MAKQADSKFVFALAVIKELSDLILAAEELGRLGGEEKEKKVLKEFREYIDTLPQDGLPNFFKSEDNLKWIINAIVIISNFATGKYDISKMISRFLP